MKAILSLVLLFAFVNVGNAEILDAYNSVCTIHVELEEGWSGGTGFVYEEDKDYYFVMTAGHVVDGCIQKFCLLNFFDSGKALESVKGEIFKVDFVRTETINDDIEIRDIAVLKVAKKDLKDFSPKVIPLAPADKNMAEDEKVFSLGCPDLRWPSAFLGRISRAISERYYFKPNVIGGRSGSPVYNEDCTMVIGVVIWTTPDGGVAISPYGIHLHNFK